MESLPLGLPLRSQVLDIAQLVLFDYKAQAAAEAKARADGYRFRLQVDRAESGCSLSFAKVRPPANPPFSKVATQVQGIASQTRLHSFLCREYGFRDAGRLPLHAEVSFAGCMAEVVWVGQGCVTLKFCEQDVVLPASGMLQHDRLESSVEVVQEALCSYFETLVGKRLTLNIGPAFVLCWPVSLHRSHRWHWTLLIRTSGLT